MLIFSLQHLYASFEEESEFLQFATSITSNDAEEIQECFDKAVGARSILILLI
jgi:DNA ligase-1